MHFVWHEAKNKLNKQKHDLSFAFAQHIFADPHLLSWIDDRLNNNGEERWISLGSIDLLVLTVVHTQRKNNYGEETTRIISARRATKKEETTYFKNRRRICG